MKAFIATFGVHIPRPFDRVFELSISVFDMDDAGPSQTFSEGILNGQIGQVGTQFESLGILVHINCIA